MAYNWKSEHDRLYNAPPTLPLGRRATVCVGGCMDGEVVYAGIVTRFFRKVDTSLEGTQVHSYRLVKGPLADTFILEDKW
jgi:hypothetical protein